jgi:hypothetical protein
VKFLGAQRQAVALEEGVRHIEIWAQLAESNRFLRRATLLAFALAFLALAAGSFGLLAGLYWPRAFHVDGDGQASYVGRLHQQLGPNEAEVRYVAKLFFKRYVAMNSLAEEQDLDND